MYDWRLAGLCGLRDECSLCCFFFPSTISAVSAVNASSASSSVSSGPGGLSGLGVLGGECFFFAHL